MRDSDFFWDKVLVGLVLFSSMGWIVDASNLMIKFLVFLGILLISARRIIINGFVEFRHEIIFLIGAVCFFPLMGVFFHGRESDWGVLFKIFVALIVAMAIPAHRFWSELPKVLALIFPLILVGFFFQIIGIAFSVPTQFLDSERESYLITPALTVFRERDAFRGYGYFWEPGVLAFVCNMSILAKIYWGSSAKEKYWIEICLLALSQSAGGAIAAIAIYVVGYVKDFRTQFVICLGFVFVVFFAFGDFFLLKEMVAYFANIFTIPLFGRDLNYDPSFNARFADMYVPFLLASEKMFGFSDIDYLMLFSDAFRGQSEGIITNSFGFVAYFYGIPGFLIFLFSLGWAAFRFSKGKNLLLIVLFVLMYSSNPLSQVLFTIVFLFLAGQRGGACESRKAR